MPRNPDKPPGYYCDGTRHDPACPDKKACTGCAPPCGARAGHGTPHPGVGRCSRHGGNTRSHVLNARELQAVAACKRLGVSIEIDPGEALMYTVWQARGACEYFRALVEDLEAQPGHIQVIEQVGGPDDGQKTTIMPPPAVWAPTHHANGQPTGRAEPHVLYRLWAMERDRLEHASVAALNAGVAQRMLDLAEDTARRLVDGFVAFARAMGQDPASPTVRAAMRAALEQARGEVVDGTAREIQA